MLQSFRCCNIFLFLIMQLHSRSLLSAFPENRLSRFGAETGLRLYNLQNVHRTGLCADTAGNTLGSSRRGFCLYHQTKRTGFHTFSAAGTQFFIHHIYALCVLLNRSSLTDLCTLAALRTCHGAHRLLFYNLNAGFIRIKLFVKWY